MKSMSLIECLLKRKSWSSIYPVLDGQCAQTGVKGYADHLAAATEFRQE